MKPCSFVVAMIVFVLFAGTAVAERLSVNVPQANIRFGPGTNYKILWKVEKYHPLQIIQKSGDWCKFRDFEGDTGWISKDLVRKIPTVIVKKKRCNVRKGPNKNTDVCFIVDRGVPLKVVEHKKGWIHVRHADGEEGWIRKDLVW